MDVGHSFMPRNRKLAKEARNKPKSPFYEKLMVINGHFAPTSMEILVGLYNGPLFHNLHNGGKLHTEKGGSKRPEDQIGWPGLFFLSQVFIVQGAKN